MFKFLFCFLVCFYSFFSLESATVTLEDFQSKEVKICAELCSDAYKDNSSFIGKTLSIDSFKFKILHACHSPLGAFSVVSDPCHLSEKQLVRTLIVVFRGTEHRINPTTPLIDIGFVKKNGDNSSEIAKKVHELLPDSRVNDALLAAEPLLSPIFCPIGAEAFDLAVVSALGFVRRSNFEFQNKKYTSVKRLIITGHSLGGIYAQCIGTYLGISSLTFNSPGAGEILENVLGTLARLDPSPNGETEDRNLVKHFILEGDQIGMHGNHIVHPTIIPYDDSKVVKRMLLSLTEMIIFYTPKNPTENGMIQIAKNYLQQITSQNFEEIMRNLIEAVPPLMKDLVKQKARETRLERAKINHSIDTICCVLSLN